MFSYLLETIFPYVGEFFGKLSAIAGMSVGEFTECLRWVHQQSVLPNGWFDYYFLSYRNFFTGEILYFQPFYNLPPILSVPSGWVLRILFVGVPSSMPLWVALLISSVELYFVIALFRFVIGLF